MTEILINNYLLEEISENDSASVSAMSLTVVISLSPICRCFTSVGDRFPAILFIGVPCFSAVMQLHQVN